MTLERALLSVEFNSGLNPATLRRRAWEGSFIEFYFHNLPLRFKRFKDSYGWDWTPSFTDMIADDWEIVL